MNIYKLVIYMVLCYEVFRMVEDKRVKNSIHNMSYNTNKGTKQTQNGARGENFEVVKVRKVTGRV